MRGLGQIAWLASFARPDVGADHERRARPPRARRDGRERRAREGRADRRRCRPGGIAVVPGRAAARAVPDAHRHRDPALRRVEAGRDAARAARDELHGPRTSSRTRSPRSRSATCSACRLADGALEVEFSPLREEEIELAGGSCSSTTATTRTRSRCAPRSQHLAERAGDAARSRCSARWPSSAPDAAALPPRGRRAAAELGVDELVAVGPLARELRRPRGGVATRRRGRAPRVARAAPARATSCSSRARARWDSRRSRRNSRALDGTRPRRGARRADHLDPRRPGLHRLPAPARVRPADPRGGARSTTRPSRARRRWAAC